MVIDIDAVMLMVYVNIYEYVINAPSTAHGARSAAATELRRPAPSRSFCVSRLDATR